MKLALVTDQILLKAGSERVFQYFCEAFPDADAYTSAYNIDTTWEYFRGRKIHATWLQRFVRTHKAFQYSFPVTTHVMEALDLRRYDAVLSLSASVSKYVNAPPGRHLCYCLTPTRALWNEEEYFRAGLKKTAVKAVLSHLRRRDYAAAQRVDRFLCISEVSRRQIERHYRRQAEVIHSPIDLERFSETSRRREHYLLVSRLERWKKLEYAIEAFNRLGYPLRIIGTGVDEAYLRSMAKGNIQFIGSVSDRELAAEYARATAVIFTPELEYGLVPLEANASGTPVICYGRGAVHETMISWTPGSRGRATAVFFDEQTPESLITAIRLFESHREDFDAATLRRHAQRWGIPEFKRRIAEALESFLAGDRMSSAARLPRLEAEVAGS